MKRLMPGLFAALSCCMIVLPVAAQDKPTSTASTAARNMSDDQTKVKSTYDEAKNETTVEFRQVALASNETQRVFLSVSATYAGKTPPSQLEDVIFIISVVSPERYQYPDMMAMKVSTDGNKLPEVLMLNLDKRPFNPGYLETIGTRMKLEVFKRLAQAKSVDLQLHDLKLRLNETEIAKLREIEVLIRN
jgi:hypothetical protein